MGLSTENQEPACADRTQNLRSRMRTHFVWTVILNLPFVCFRALKVDRIRMPYSGVLGNEAFRLSQLQTFTSLRIIILTTLLTIENARIDFLK